MRSLASLSLAVLLMSSCSVGVYGRHDRAAVEVAPEFWGTVTYVGADRIDLDYVEGGVHYVRPVYHTRAHWDGVSYTDLHNGDRIWVRGRGNKGRWDAENIRRYQ